MTACLGQQNVDGKRIPYGFIDRTFLIILKTMIHLKQEDLLKIHLYLDKLLKNISFMQWVVEKV